MKIGQKPELPSPVTPQASSKASAKTVAAASDELAKNAAPASAAVATSAGVPVSVSNSARALDRMSRSSSDFNADKVKAMRAAIENGTFAVNAEAIASKMLAGAAEFL